MQEHAAGGRYGSSVVGDDDVYVLSDDVMFCKIITQIGSAVPFAMQSVY